MEPFLEIFFKKWQRSRLLRLETPVLMGPSRKNHSFVYCMDNKYEVIRLNKSGVTRKLWCFLCDLFCLSFMDISKSYPYLIFVGLFCRIKCKKQLLYFKFCLKKLWVKTRLSLIVSKPKHFVARNLFLCSKFMCKVQTTTIPLSRFIDQK